MTITTKNQNKRLKGVELDRLAMKNNLNIFRKMLNKNCQLLAVVKSNAYGHDLVLFSKELERLGVKYFGVDSIEEAIVLRNAKIKSNILVLGFTSPDFYKESIKKNIEITISNKDSLFALKSIKGKIKIQIKVDTGLGRQGFKMEDLETVLDFLTKRKNIEVVGVFSHLAVGEDPKKRDYTEKQVSELNIWHEAFLKKGFKPKKHISATASTMIYPEYHFDMVRIGIGLCGLFASQESKEVFEKKYKLLPVLSWKTIITEIKDFKKGESIGYDLTETLKRDSKLAIIPVGYYNGYPRLLSLKGTFDVNGVKVKIIGRVSMNMIILDVTDVKNVKVYDEVSIIGGKNNNYAEAYNMAKDSETITYEITTRINPIIKRFYGINPKIKRFLR
jgi:alanine racemase